MLDNKFYEFIDEHHVMGLSVSQNNTPYSFSCFYSYLKDKNLFVFSSDIETTHAQIFTENNKVSGIIHLETKTVGKIQGLQLTGKLIKPEGDLKKIVRKKYLLDFPYAAPALLKTKLWIIEPNFFKLTDNRLGFGKKLIWEKQ